MENYTLTGTHYLYPTPAGTYHAIGRAQPDSTGAFLQRLLRVPETPLLDGDLAQQWTGLPGQDALQFIYRLQTAGLIQGLPAPLRPPAESIEQVLPALLASLSHDGRVLLAERRGLQISSVGFAHEACEELAALGAELAGIRQRHAGLLNGNLRMRAEGWALVGAGGYSEIGFWPMCLGDEQFVLVISGQPQFNQAALTTLAWTLGLRYGRSN